MLSSLVCLGRHTITGLLHAAGESFQDWSALYRVFSQSRLDSEALFAAVRRGVVAQLRPGEPLVVALDDSLLPKRGTKTPGVAWRRDPLGPPFQTNLIRAQRVVEIAAALPAGERPGPARLIPIDFQHAPTPPKPRQNASEEERQQYREASRKASLARRGAARLHALRQNLDQEHDDARRLEVLVDGRFTNRVVLKNLPPSTVLIGRLRQDAKLYQLPAGKGAATGRAAARLSHQNPGAAALASGRRPHQLALGGHRAARLSAPQRLAAVVSPPGLSARHRHRAVPATDRPALRLALGHRGQLP